MEIKDGKFLVDRKDPATQRLLLTSINDNIYKNLDGFSVKLFNIEDNKRW